MNYLDVNRNEIFKKYSDKELIKDVENFVNGKGMLYKVANHFYEELIFESKSIRGNKSPMEALQDNELMCKILEYIDSKPNFYVSKNEVSNVKSFFRNGGKWACKVANFSPKNALEIYNRYSNEFDKDDIWILDTSAGFGSRMSASLLCGFNYTGIDPNVKLGEQLNKCYNFYLNNNLTNKDCEIIVSGSEIEMPHLFNKHHISFTSPPYFNLEVYSNDYSASTKNLDNYENWINNFAKPTIENTYKYLVIGGYAMINIKNSTRSPKYKLFDDWFDIFKSIDGFEFIEVFEMEHQAKKYYYQNSTYSKEDYSGFKEPIMVFKKVR